MSAPVMIRAEFPATMDFLLGKKARHKVLFGGRGGARSWSMVRALLIEGIQKPGLRVLCAREVQSSMRESVHQLIRDQIKLMGLESLYRVLESEIRGPGGTTFTFKGLSDPDALKSSEGVDRVFLEEARSITKTSWEKLDPTIRKEDSQIWIAFNPELEQDFIYQLFVANPPPPDSIVVKCGWQSNPWFPEVLRIQMEHMRATNYDDYLHVWEGHCKNSLEGAVYANELRAMTKEERIMDVPYLPGKPVHTFWDLGYADHTSIWFVQAIGFRYHFIDYYEANREQMDHYLQVLQNRPYLYGTDWLPHDAKPEHLGMERTPYRQMKDANRQVKITPKLSIPDGINAVRSILPVCVFDRVKCARGIDRLRAYRYEINEKKGKWSQSPVHDEASHAADALRYAGVALRGDTEKPKVAKANVPRGPGGNNTDWMGV